MKHLRVATYDITHGTFDEIAKTAKEGLLPEFRGQPGFIRYGVANVGHKTIMSISLWESREQAAHASSLVERWVNKNLSDKVSLKKNFVGDLAFLEEREPAAV